MSGRNLAISIQCSFCSKQEKLRVKREDFNQWQSGESIKHVMPFLSSSERELLISGMCEPCFESAFTDPEPNENHYRVEGGLS